MAKDLVDGVDVFYCPMDGHLAYRVTPPVDYGDGGITTLARCAEHVWSVIDDGAAGVTYHYWGNVEDDLDEGVETAMDVLHKVERKNSERR